MYHLDPVSSCSSSPFEEALRGLLDGTLRPYETLTRRERRAGRTDCGMVLAHPDFPNCLAILVCRGGDIQMNCAGCRDALRDQARIQHFVTMVRLYLTDPSQVPEMALLEGEAMRATLHHFSIEALHADHETKAQRHLNS